MEAHGSARHWTRTFQVQSLEVRLLPARHVRAMSGAII